MVDNTAIKVQTWSASLHWYSSVHFPQLAAGAPKKISRHHYGTSGNECRHHAGWRTAFAVLLRWENIICSELSCPRNIADFFFFFWAFTVHREACLNLDLLAFKVVLYFATTCRAALTWKKMQWERMWRRQRRSSFSHCCNRAERIDFATNCACRCAIIKYREARKMSK